MPASLYKKSPPSLATRRALVNIKVPGKMTATPDRASAQATKLTSEQALIIARERFPNLSCDGRSSASRLMEPVIRPADGRTGWRMMTPLSVNDCMCGG
jgi:hypothetical protein